MFLILLIHFLVSASCVKHSLVNSTFFWHNFTVCNLISDGFNVFHSANSYQIIEDVSPNQLVLSSNYAQYSSNNPQNRSPKGKPYIQNTKPFRIRADSPILFIVDINSTFQTCDNSIQASGFLNILYRRASNDILSWKILHSYCGLGCDAGSQKISQNFTSSYQLYRINSVQWCLQPLPCINTNYFKSSINITHFNQIFLNQGYIKATDYLQYTRHQYILNTSASIKFQTFHQLSAIHLTDEAQIPLDDFIIFSQYYGRNLSNSDFLNITISPYQTTLNRTIVSFSFGNEIEVLTASVCALIGFYNGTWSTPLKFQNLPAIISKNWSILVNFQYTKIQILQSTKRQVCTFAYISTLNNKITFINNNPDIVVAVCYEWMRLSPINTLASYMIHNINYILFEQNKQSWKQYLFYSRSPSTDHQIDLFPFIQIIKRQYQLSNNLYVSALQAGIRIYGQGYGKYEFNKITFNVTEQKQDYCILPLLTNCKQNEQSLFSTLLFVFSTPDLSLLLRIFPLNMFIDGISYFAYHTVKYNAFFSSFSIFCWNVTNQQYTWRYLRPLQTPNKILTNEKINTPGQFIKMNEGVIFLNNTINLWVFYFPSSVCLFLVVFIFLKLVKLPRLRFILSPFKSILSLFIYFLNTNVQYLSFRSSQQLLFLVPTQSYLSVLNLFCTLLVFFLLVLGCIGFHLIFLNSQYYDFGLKAMNNSIKSRILLSEMLILRLISGFIHAYFQQEVVQIFGLLSINLTLIVSILIVRKSFKNNIDFIFLIGQRLTYIYLYIILLLEIYKPEIYSDLESTRSIMSKVNFYCILIMIVLILLQLMFHLTQGILQLISFSDQTIDNKPNQQILNNQSMQAAKNKHQFVIKRYDNASRTSRRKKKWKTQFLNINQNLNGQKDKITIKNVNCHTKPYQLTIKDILSIRGTTNL